MGYGDITHALKQAPCMGHEWTPRHELIVLICELREGLIFQQAPKTLKSLGQGPIHRPGKSPLYQVVSLPAQLFTVSCPPVKTDALSSPHMS